MEWEAFERVEPFGDVQMDRRFKVLGAWLCTMLGSKAYQADDIKGISPELPDLDADAADLPFDDCDEPLAGDLSVRASSVDVLQAWREINFFR